jgi:transposase
MDQQAVRASVPEPCFVDSDSVQAVCQRTMGSLPVLREYFEASGMRAVLDDLCPSAKQATITHADAVLALVCNRLTSPQPLYRVEDWASQFAVEECLGLSPVHLNDDRLAATLDVLAERPEEIYGAIAALTVERFDIDTRIIHRDLTDIAFHGGYDGQDPQFARVLFGWPGANVPKGCKIVRQDVATSEDGAVPLMIRSLSGNACDVNTVIDTLEALRTKSKANGFILVGDTKLVSEGNLHRILADGCDFLAPVTKNEAVTRELLALPAKNWVLLPYLSEREGKRHRRGTIVNRFYGQETMTAMTVAVALPTGHQGPRVLQTFAVRQVNVLSEEERAAARKSREARLLRVEHDLHDLSRKAGNYKTLEQLNEKVAKSLRARKAIPLFNVAVERNAGSRPCKLTYSRNLEAITLEERRDGLYRIETSVSSEEMSTNEVLRTFKKQGRLEARHADLKGPLAVNPVYLKGNQRIVGLLLIIGLALLIYTLIERQARKALEPAGGMMQGLYPEGRESRPTARQILSRLATMSMVCISIGGKDKWIPVSPDPVQQLLLRMLKLPNSRRPAPGAA